MKETTRNISCRIFNSVILAGVIILLIGLYYSVIKAGIPYQDPPMELQINYAINMRIGKILMGKGLLIATCGGIIRLILGLILKKQRRK